MSKRPLLSANLRSVPTGPLEGATMPNRTGAQVIGLDGRRPTPSALPWTAAAAERPDSPASIVVDAFATASVLSCLAWTQGALLPLRLAAYAWQQTLPRAIDDGRPQG